MSEAKADDLRLSGEAERNRSSGTWTAGIDAMRHYPGQDEQWHLHAIEFHHKDKAEAERLRDEWFTLRAQIAEAEAKFSVEHRRYNDASRRADDYRKKSNSWKAAAETAEASLARARKALEEIANWELPATGDFWDRNKTEPVSYEATYGSNGVRDYIREIARAALQEEPKP